ncbi:beta-2-microglobulin-like [Morone saxatilis]|uniref:beta-2-microglobulin-like n=1 Tax=Morone saxatilis TaxID=34816 RepID=UPI0015E21CBD|nr:beta-2-microglobulin-like [Morone saxatilis]
MKEVVCAVLVTLLCLAASSMAKESPPKVQVYSREPGQVGKPNTLICHVSGFHPPQITIKLLVNGEEIKDARQSDLAFGEDWHYHLTKHVPFTPNKEQTFSCKVSHMGNTNNYIWEPDM